MAKYCNFHGKNVEEKTYKIFALQVETTHNSYKLGLLSLIDDLSRYALAKGYHLSGSQIILLRPDVFIPFLEKKIFNKKYEKVLDYNITSATICKTCYEDVKKEVPLV